MKWYEEIGQPGFVIDLMTAIFIVAALLATLFFVIARGSWRNLAITVVSYSLVFGARFLWRRSKRRRSQPQ